MTFPFRLRWCACSHDSRFNKHTFPPGAHLPNFQFCTFISKFFFNSFKFVILTSICTLYILSKITFRDWFKRVLSMFFVYFLFSLHWYFGIVYKWTSVFLQTRWIEIKWKSGGNSVRSNERPQVCIPGNFSAPTVAKQTESLRVGVICRAT